MEEEKPHRLYEGRKIWGCWKVVGGELHLTRNIKGGLGKCVDTNSSVWFCDGGIKW